MLKSMKQKRKILLLDANPAGSSSLRLEREARAISETVRASAHRDLIQFVLVGPVRPNDLSRAIVMHKPDVIHFSGHGRPDAGVLAYDESGEAKAISGEALAALFESTQSSVKVVMLNACYSAPQAEAISAVVPYVINMKERADDLTTRDFAATFYTALFSGRSVEEAYKMGVGNLTAKGIAQRDAPDLITRGGLNADETGRGSLTFISILPEEADSYRAIVGRKESTGRTAGEALDALTSQLADDEGGTLVIVQTRKTDRFFNAAQRERLTELMSRRGAGALSLEEEKELEALVEAELNGARRRAENLLHELKP